MSQDQDFLDSPRLREYLVAELTYPAGAAPAPIDPRVVDFLLGRIRDHRGASTGGYEEFRQSAARLVLTARRLALAQRGSRRVRLGDMRAACGLHMRTTLWPFG